MWHFKRIPSFLSNSVFKAVSLYYHIFIYICILKKSGSLLQCINFYQGSPVHNWFPSNTGNKQSGHLNSVEIPLTPKTD